MLQLVITTVGLTFIIAMLSICLYQIIKAKNSLIKIKMKLSQNTIATRVLFKNIKNIEANLKNNSNLLQQIDTQTVSPPNTQNQIENQYERAKRILRKGSDEDINNLHSCDMTNEEIELLTDLMHSPDYTG